MQTDDNVGLKEIDDLLLLEESLSLPQLNTFHSSQHSPDSSCSSRSSSFDHGGLKRERLNSCDSGTVIEEIMRVATYNAMDTSNNQQGFSELGDLQGFLDPEPTILTPASTPPEEVMLHNLQPHLQPQEWTYLEVVAPLPSLSEISPQQLSPPVQVQQMHQLQPSQPQQLQRFLSDQQWQQHQPWQQSDPVVAIKSEPILAPEVFSSQNSYPIPVHLLKREYCPPQSDVMTVSSAPATFQSAPPSFSDLYAHAQQQQQQPPLEPPAGKKAPGKISRENSASSDSELCTGPRLCHVCGEKAGKHSYYGGQVCPSCRAFFRRSVQSKYSDIYTCNKDQNCDITLKTRKNCQFCRFRRCEGAGMKRSWVLADGDKRPTAAATASSPDKEKKLPLCAEDKETIKAIVDIMKRIKHQTEELNAETMSEITHTVLHKNKSLSMEGRRGLKKVLEQRARLFAINIKEFTTLSEKDQIALLDANTGTLIKFRLATFFRTELNWKKQMDLIMGQSDMTKLMDKVTGLKLAGNERLEYGQVFTSPWCHSEQSEREHKVLLDKISHLVEDETTFCLLNLIILFNSSTAAETSSVEHRCYCDAQVERFTHLLQRYLRSRFNTSAAARKKLTDAVQVISYCRELEEMAVSRCMGLVSECKA